MDWCQRALTVDHHVNRVLFDVRAGHHHAGERALVAQLGSGEQQAGVGGHVHAALVFVGGAD